MEKKEEENYEGIEVISVGRKGVLEGGMGAHSSRSFSGAL